jgi:hypothetical protein
MSRNNKIILAVLVGALLVLCLCGCAVVLATSFFFINNTVTTGGSVRAPIEEVVQVGPAQIEDGEAIASLTLPNGWRADYSVKVGGFRLAGYRPESGNGHVMLVVVPETSATSVAELEKEARGLASQYGYKWNQTELTVVERKPVTVRDQATEMVIAEGTGSGGPWRQAMVSFRGDRGLTLVIYGMPKASYEQATADALFASIH